MSTHNLLLEQVRDLLRQGTLKSSDITELVVKRKKEAEKTEERSPENAENFTYHESTSMGIGDLGAHNRIWPRVFRFQLFSENEKLVNVFVQTVELDLKNQTMEVHVLEGDHKIYDWVKQMISGSSDNFVLTTYNGCGQPLYSIRFEGVEANAHKFTFDYSKSDVTTHELKFIFDKFKRTNLVESYKTNPQNPPFAKKKGSVNTLLQKTT